MHRCVSRISGHPIALYNLGGHYFAGKGVEQSFEKASESFQQAANIGFAPAQVCLIVQAALSKLPLYTVPVQRLYALDPYMTAFLLFCLIYIHACAGKPWQHVLQWSGGNQGQSQG